LYHPLVGEDNLHTLDVGEAMRRRRYFSLRETALCLCISALLIWFPRHSAAAELITPTPGPAIQKFTVSFSIAKPALQPSTSTPTAFAPVNHIAYARDRAADAGASARRAS
jgi:hypothetical protein